MSNEFIPWHIYQEEDYKPFGAELFSKCVKEEIKIQRFADRVEITVPCVFSGKTEDFLVTFRPLDAYSGAFSDGGKALENLQKRVGDLAPYQKWLGEFTRKETRVQFVGGRILTLNAFGLHGRYSMQSAFHDFLFFVSIVANLDGYGGLL